MRVIPYFHLFADGDWEPPLREYFAALGSTASPCSPIRVGVVGHPRALLAVRQWLTAHRDQHPATIVAYHGDGWEQITLEFLHAEAATTDLPFLYAHSKGAANASDLNIAWRRSMLEHVVARWPEHLDKLSNNDIIGTRWLRSHPSGVGFFAGNFWMARADFIRRLPPLQYDNRYQAETWIGQQPSTHLDLCPGWPAAFNLRSV